MISARDPCCSICTRDGSTPAWASSALLSNPFGQVVGQVVGQRLASSGDTTMHSVSVSKESARAASTWSTTPPPDQSAAGARISGRAWPVRVPKGATAVTLRGVWLPWQNAGNGIVTVRWSSDTDHCSLWRSSVAAAGNSTLASLCKTSFALSP